MNEENKDKIANFMVWVTKWIMIALGLSFVGLVGYVLVTDIPNSEPSYCKCKNNE